MQRDADNLLCRLFLLALHPKCFPQLGEVGYFSLLVQDGFYVSVDNSKLGRDMFYIFGNPLDQMLLFFLLKVTTIQARSQGRANGCKGNISP